jgi:predicted transport protein
MEVYRDFRAQKLSKAELLHIVRLVDSYVFRRAICNVPTNSMNRTFATLAKFINPTNYVESIEAQFVMLTSYRRFPRDDEFQREFQTRDLYNFPRRSYYLRRLENYNRDEPISVGEYTIEHIMPQNPDLSSEWRRGLGLDWQKVQSTWLHTLGNLTLTAYNSSYSDRPFLIKRDMPSDPETGIAKSPLHLNAGIGFLDNWDESTIKDRAARLAQRGLKVWSAPTISTDTVKKYAKKTTRQEYGIDNFPSIHTGKMKSLFDAFRQAVLELDSNITEEFLKLYVAYKADTNIVDVIPLANKLKLTLNMRFINISDPHGICTDVSNVGRWGNGEVEVMLNSVDEIPYIIGLVRQSLDSQLGDEG